MTAAPAIDPVEIETKVLRRLREPGAKLVVARDVPFAGLFITPPNLPPADCPRRPQMTVPIADCAHLLREGYIEVTHGRQTSVVYTITQAGRARIIDLLRADRPSAAAPSGKVIDWEQVQTWAHQRRLRKQGRIV